MFEVFRGLAGRRKAEAIASGDMEWFAHDPALVAAAGRSASEFWRDAEKHLKAALAIQPAALNLAFTLAQVDFCPVAAPQVAFHDHNQHCRFPCLARFFACSVWTIVQRLKGLRCGQMYCALGKHSQALEAASRLCELAPHDADAHALHLLLLQAQGIDGHEQASRAGNTCCQLLRCDPGAHRCSSPPFYYGGSVPSLLVGGEATIRQCAVCFYSGLHPIG